MTKDLTALLGGAAARIFAMHHPAFSINSLCHRFGKQDYDRADESRNLAFPICGEGWHNAYHAFPDLLPGMRPMVDRSTSLHGSSS